MFDCKVLRNSAPYILKRQVNLRGGKPLSPANIKSVLLFLGVKEGNINFKLLAAAEWYGPYFPCILFLCQLKALYHVTSTTEGIDPPTITFLPSRNQRASAPDDELYDNAVRFDFKTKIPDKWKRFTGNIQGDTPQELQNLHYGTLLNPAYEDTTVRNLFGIRSENNDENSPLMMIDVDTEGKRLSDEEKKEYKSTIQISWRFRDNHQARETVQRVGRSDIVIRAYNKDNEKKENNAFFVNMPAGIDFFVEGEFKKSLATVKGKQILYIGHCDDDDKVTKVLAVCNKAIYLKCSTRSSKPCENKIKNGVLIIRLAKSFNEMKTEDWLKKISGILEKFDER